MDDRFKYFRVEAREILDRLGQGALDLEKGAPPADLVAGLLRHAHTLKGAARVVKQREIAACAHSLEEALAPVRDTSGPVSRDRVDRVLSIVDQIATYVAQLTPISPSPAASGSEPPDQPLMTFRPAMEDLDSVLGGVFEAHVALGALRARLAQVARGRDIASLVTDQLSRSRDSDAGRTNGQSSNERARSLTEELRATLGTLERDLGANIDQLDQELQQVREAAERVRLVPANALFTFLERAVRDVAVSLDKRATFDTQGGDVRIDPLVLNVLQGALLHIVRNAAAHGIEGAAERRAAGKPADGRIMLHISQRGRLVSFVCTDDGRGIDLEAVRRMAQRKDFRLDPDKTFEPAELLRLLLKGGLSTTDTVTDLSGRGIGLDVVRDAAERLGGTVSARTETGKGTTIEIEVPLSIASFDALGIEVGEGTVAIPLYAVRGILHVPRDKILRLEQTQSVLFDGRAIPLVSLQQAVSMTADPARALPYALTIVVQGSGGVAGFSADRILGISPVVMRPLPSLAPATSVVAGVSLDAVGDPQLILDPDSLVAAAQRGETLTREPAPARLSILVVDDSLTTRMLEQSILESAGYDVDLATSGEEALERARAAQYSLFLVDVEMPGMDGFTFVERIRADPSLQRIPSILVTSRNAPEDRQRGRDVGAQGYMVKSEFDQGVLLERIRALVG